MRKTYKPFISICLFIFLLTQITLRAEPDVNQNIIPSFNILSSLMDGPTFEFGIIDVYEVAGDQTVGTITVTLPKDPKFTFAYDSSLTSAGLYTVNNAQWTYDNTNPNFHIWTTGDAIPANGKSSIGFIFGYNTEGDGEVSYSVSLLSGSGGETNDTNNTDIEVVTYFTK